MSDDPYAPQRAPDEHGAEQLRRGQSNPDIPYYDGRHPGHRQRKRRRVFLWIFLAVQALFLAWVIGGAVTVHTGPTAAQLASGCYHHHWWPLFTSQADCVTHYGGALRGAGNLGKGIGLALVIIFWMVVDVILGVSYGVYRLATRERLGRGYR